jgi:predicted SnoaL-like aldol condensation-catalyzing enzyme
VTNADLIRNYLDRVVNQQDLSDLDQLVASDYRGDGYGWPATRSELRDFYVAQSRARPDWRIDIQSTFEVGDCVVVHAQAGGTVVEDEHAEPLKAPIGRQVEWLAAYWLRDAHIARIEILALVPRADPAR